MAGSHMDTEGFVAWALHPARTVEERFSVELLIESPLQTWHFRHKTGDYDLPADQHAHRRERYLNPAYQPIYSERDLRRALEILPETTSINWTIYYHDRPPRDIGVFRFLPQLETLHVNGEISDLSVLPQLPALRTLVLGGLAAEDFRPVGECTRLRNLSLDLACHWPEIPDLARLHELESLTLRGNLLVFPRGLTFPRVRGAYLACAPLNARALQDLPHLPACEFLTLQGVERLDGIEEMPRLRNLTLTGPVRDFAPLTALRELTWFTYTGSSPLNLEPIAALPRLQFAQFNAPTCYHVQAQILRDYSPLMAAPALHEVIVTGAAPQELEIAALNAALVPWDGEFLAETPRAIPPLRMIIAPKPHHFYRQDPPPGPELPDTGVRQCEARWVSAQATKWIGQRIGHSDWGSVSPSHQSATVRGFFVTVECYEVVERLPKIIEGAREAIARLRHDYMAELMIALRVPPPTPTAAQQQLSDRFQDEQNEASYEQHRRDMDEHLERLYLYQLKQQEGEEIDPAEFSASEPVPPPPAPWEVESDEEDEDDDSEVGIAVKKKPDPPPDYFDDEHPLADNYRLLASITLDEVWFMTHHRGLAIHLMGREPDREIPEEEKVE